MLKLLFDGRYFRDCRYGGSKYLPFTQGVTQVSDNVTCPLRGYCLHEGVLGGASGHWSLFFLLIWRVYGTQLLSAQVSLVPGCRVKFGQVARVYSACQGCRLNFKE
jgi:hypothetical protein